MNNSYLLCLFCMGILILLPISSISIWAEPNPPGFDAPDPEVDPNFNCPDGYFYEGNHEIQNGPDRCTLFTCENRSDLPGCTENDNTYTNNQILEKISEIGKLKQQIRDELKHDTCSQEEIDAFMDTIQQQMIQNKYGFDDQISYLQGLLKKLNDTKVEKGDVDCTFMIPLLPKPGPLPPPTGPINNT